MRLYFLRHAEAHPGADDDARELTKRGEEQSREIGRFLRQVGVEFGAAYSSPLVRARQTAEIVLETTNADTDIELEITEALCNETTQAVFNRWLGQLPDKKHILLVGHAPSMPARVQRLLGIENNEALPMPKAGLACIKPDNPRQGTLKFFVSPKILR
jgi:phosphohistidine phosphatase